LSKNIPRIDNIINTQGDSNYVNNFGVAKGFSQCILQENSLSRSALFTPLGQYVFTDMLFTTGNWGSV
jgi:hypothetical protein